ncbi:pilus assembly protein [Dyella mobilis]|uniref:PilY1 beta-propeller domain-containing protein n=1 Tax=Dyella mobilis TaxID=1849582 RepID=A0ABS2KK28_9GAMM|nr:PilC/PilY family type IV pilus protein [Dyella mobilis]MBM7131512.1 hypothetical protein [Dyella mobilis]GLQ96517.1 hypothetical protein GCM10007863_09350 [Dyella mobilis]
MIGACLCALSTSSLQAAENPPANTVELSPLPLDNTQAAPSLAVLGLNGSVTGAGLLAFQGGYNPMDWSGVLRAATVDDDGAPASVVWDAGVLLTNASVTPPDRRTLLTAGMTANGIAGMAFEPAAAFDEAEVQGLMTPAPEDALRDTLAARVDYLRGVRGKEQDGTLRPRSSLLGAIIHAQAVYVGYPAGRYRDHWPTRIHDKSVRAPEMEAGAQTYATFVADQADRTPTLYIAANDGMLHAFLSPQPDCERIPCKLPSDAGKERWAYLPRAAYANLGNLTQALHFQFQPTVDATPATRDVFFGERGRHEWHTLLTGGLGLGGRGVYALDVARASLGSSVFPSRTVLWEFDADAAPGLSMAGDAYRPADLGYTYGQPAVARLASGQWAVLVPGGYFPDCSKSDRPARCESAAEDAPADYAALFVLDAQTGEVIRELKTPTSIPGVSGYGLATPVLGDYDDDQIDDIAFAGDLAGNLWRFDLSSPRASDWTVTLAFRPAVQGDQPITTSPRLFPGPATGRFMVVFGTGKYLGAGDRSADIPVQSLYGIRDRLDGRGRPLTATRTNLRAQALSQTVVDGATLRNLSSVPLSAKDDGWYVDLNVVPGERVVITPTALFNTGSVLVTTLIPDGPAHAGPQSAVMAVDAATGGAGNAVSFQGGSYVGGLTDKPRSSGSLPVATAIGGGKLILPGISLQGGRNKLPVPLSFDSPIWRRRSWTLLTPDD